LIDCCRQQPGKHAKPAGEGSKSLDLLCFLLVAGMTAAGKDTGAQNVLDRRRAA